MKIVIVDDDEVLLRTLARRLTLYQWQVITYSQPVTAETLLAEQADVYLLDLRFAQQSGMHFITPLRQQLPACRIILFTGYASIATAVQAIKQGADDYLTKPVDFNVLLGALSQKTSDKTSVATIAEEPLSPGEMEWEHIQRVLELQQGNISQTARILGMHRRTLQRKLAKHRPVLKG